MTDVATPGQLRAKAARYRQMALHTLDQRLLDALLTLAAEYEALAAHLEQAERTRGG